MSRFINRERETEFLERKHKQAGLQLIVLYGRRRTGKTELISRFLEGKDGIYYLADKRGTQANAKMFAKEAAKHFGDVEPSAGGFDDVFSYIVKRAGKQRVVVAIDEFSYLVEKDDSVPSVFQKICDIILRDSNITLILCGSSISMMEQGVLSYKSPLYGRRTGEWKLTPLKYKDAIRFFPNYTDDDKIRAVMILGGIPAYLAEFSGTAALLDGIKTKVLKKGEFLYNEVNFLLQEELRDPATYMKILSSMSSGATKVVNIANKSYMNAKDLPKYLYVLQKLEYVKKIQPITEKKKTKKTVYVVSDNFFRFWFEFVAANKSDLEMNKIDEVAEKIKHGLDSFLGMAFEQLCEETLYSMKLPLKPTKIGRWWGHYREDKQRKEVDIDIVCMDENKKRILFIECKWSDLKENEARKILGELKEKTKFVEHGMKKEHLGLIARKINGKENLRKDGFVAYDAADIVKGG